MTDKKRRPAKKRSGSQHKSPYFLQPAKQGTVTVFRRPAGNRIDPKLCGTMDSRAMALALVKQLEKAESVVYDLFLEATDDGIEALEAVLQACRESVMQRGAHGHSAGGAPKVRRGRGRRRGARGSPLTPETSSANDMGERGDGNDGRDPAAAEDTSAA